MSSYFWKTIPKASKVITWFCKVWQI